MTACFITLSIFMEKMREMHVLYVDYMDAIAKVSFIVIFLMCRDNVSKIILHHLCCRHELYIALDGLLKEICAITFLWFFPDRW